MSEVVNQLAGRERILQSPDCRPYLRRTEIRPVINDLALGIID